MDEKNKKIRPFIIQQKESETAVQLSNKMSPESGWPLII